MSRQTPRKARHSRQPSNKIPAVSDYESDAAGMLQSYEPPPLRSNTELNLSVLQRYLPSVRSILSIAANAVVYTFDSASGGWVKSGCEGTMFVCVQAPHPADPAQRPRACVFILNRRALDNVLVDLARVSHAEIAEQLVALRIEGQWEGGEERVLGLWVHNEKEDTREVNWKMIEESWKYARSVGPYEGPDDEYGPATIAIGKSSSVSDLFSKQNGVNAGG